jgi:diguanylate cyclase (GGDEF)-like protein
VAAVTLVQPDPRRDRRDGQLAAHRRDHITALPARRRPAQPEQRPDRTGTPTDRTALAAMHESAAGLLAGRGQWRQAYQHLRSALDLHLAQHDDPVYVPEQLRHEVDRLRREHAEAREQSRRDVLTACYNRRYLDEWLAALVVGGPARTAGLAVGLADIDHFKQVNDTFGHPLGDQVLCQVVEVITELPTGSFCARYGGEEFALVMTGMEPSEVVALCDSLRARVERHPWEDVAPGLRVTLSIGVTTLDPGDGTVVEPERLLRAADGLLYTAKQSGRNAVAYVEGGSARLAGAASGRRLVVPNHQD